MAAAPETQFSRPGLSAGTTYTPVRTELAPPIQLPGTGQLWADVGKNALNASAQVFDTMMKSPLNPKVKAEMELGRQSALRGIETIDWLRQQGAAGYLLGGVSGDKFATMPGGQVADPTLLMQLLRGKQGPKGGEGSEAGKPHDVEEKTEQPPPPAPSGGPMGAPKGMFLNPATGSYESLDQPGTEGKAPETPAQPATRVPSDPSQLTGPPKPPTAQIAPSNMWASAGPQPPAAPGFQGPTQEQTAQAIQEATQRNQFASSQPGVPAGYQPPQQPDQAAQQEAQRQQQLQAWQAQNAHPVADSQSALEWAKRFHTGYKTATYLPHGGQGGEPAYNFSDGKSSNVVPISQMVKNGFGPSVVSQNTSSALSVADQVTQQQQGPQGPGLPFGPVSPAQPQQQPAPGQQPAGPPAAPAQMTDIYGNPLSAYTSVASRGGPSPAQLTAQTAPAGQPAAVEHPTITTANGTPDKPDVDEAEVRSHVRTLSSDDLAKLEKGRDNDETGDAPAGSFAGYDWYQDRKTGLLYTFRPSPNKWREQRFYLGSRGWQDNWQTNTSAENETMENLFTKNQSQIPQHFSTSDIIHMSPAEKKYWLEQDKYFEKSSPDPNVTYFLQNAAEGIKRLDMMKNIVQAADKYGSEYSWLSGMFHQGAKFGETLATNPEADTSIPGQAAATAGRILLSSGIREHPIGVDMQDQINELGKNFAAPGMEPIANREVPASSGFNLSVPIPLGRVVVPFSLQFGAHGAYKDPLDIPAIKYITQSGDKEERLRYINQTESELKGYFQAAIKQANLDQKRVNPDLIKLGADLTAGRPVEFGEDYNDYKRNGQIVNPHQTQKGTEEYGAGKPINPRTTTEMVAPPYTSRDPNDPSFLRATKPPQIIDTDDKDAMDKFIKENRPGTEFYSKDGRLLRIK